MQLFAAVRMLPMLAVLQTVCTLFVRFAHCQSVSVSERCTSSQCVQTLNPTQHACSHIACHHPDCAMSVL